MITFLTETLESTNFGHMTLSTILFYKILLVTSWAEIITSQPLFQNICVLRKFGVAIFADIIIKIVTIFVRTISKYSNKVETTEKDASKCNLYLYFLI